MIDKNLKFKLSTVYFIIYATWASFSPFLIIYLRDRNLNYMQMGIIFAVMPLVGVVCQPFWGYITDKYLNKKLTLIITLSGSAFIILLLVFTYNFYSILICIMLLSVFITSNFPLLDTLSYEIQERDNRIQYGRVRLMGAFGYAICVILIGIVIEYTNIDVPYYIYFVLSIICIVIVGTIHHKGKSTGQRINFGDISNLFKDNMFLIFILSIMIINIPMGANMNYIGELIKQTGGNVSNLGILWSIVAISEAPVYFISNRILDKFKDTRLYCICLAFYFIRYLLDSLCASWQLVVLVQLLQALSYAIYVISGLHFLNRILPYEMKTSGITLYSASAGLGGFIGNIGAGVFLQTYSIFHLYTILSLVSLGALSVGLLLERKSMTVSR